jgi:NADH:ubiquinone oxidoreductase subunit 4 (subunit M)
MCLLAAVFLPVFPLSMGFNMLYARMRGVFLRILLLVAWPQAGVALLSVYVGDMPWWVPALAVVTSLFYGVRALALREVGLWTSFLATSAWAVLWIPAYEGVETMQLHLYALGFSAPLVLLALLARELERRYGAAYTGLYGGLAHALPRLSGVLVFVVLASIATPLFPGFFTMFSTMVTAMPAMPAAALGLAAIWLVWSWAGARLLQGLIVGSAGESRAHDLSPVATWTYGLALVALVAAGVYGTGEFI